MSTEIWKHFHNIEVSNHGNLKTPGHKDVNYTGSNVNNGYRKVHVKIDNKDKMFKVHRLVMHLFNGIALDDQRDVDHIDGNPTNNNISNLRMVTHQQNQCNLKCHRTGKLPYCNFNENKWVSQITVNNKRVYLGRFDTMKEAYDCSIKERIRLGLPV